MSVSIVPTAVPQPTIGQFQAAVPASVPVDPPALRWAVTPGAVFAALRRRWWLALTAGLIAALACGAAAWALRPDKYTAAALLRVASSELKLLQADTSGGRVEANIYARTQMALIRSRPVLQAALKDERVRQLPLIQQQPDPVEWLEKELLVEQLPSTEIVRVSLTMRGAGSDLATVVNAIVNAYLVEVVSGEQAVQKRHLNSLQTAFNATEDKVRQLRESFQSLTRTLKGGDSKILTLKQQSLLEEHSSLRRELAVLNSRLRDLEVKVAGYRLEAEPVVFHLRLPFRQFPVAPLPCPMVVRSGVGPLVDQELDSDPKLRELDAQVTKLHDQLNQFNAIGADPNSPFKVDLQRRLAAAETAAKGARAERRIVAMAAHQTTTRTAAVRFLREFETERAAVEKQRNALQEDAAALKKELDRFGLDSVDLELKRAEIDRSEEFLKAIWQQKERLEVEFKGAARQRVSVVSEAEEASILNKKGRAVEAGGAGFAGLMVALLAVAVFDLRRNRIHAATDVSRGLRLSVLGALPQLPSGTAGVARSEGKYGFGEAIDGLRTTLLTGPSGARGSRGLVVLVASAVSGEGKTTLAAQLAASFARSGRRTLLVDGDLRSPSLHRLFALELGQGVCEALTGASQVPLAVQSTGVDGLDLLSAGNLNRAAEATLAQHAAVQRLIETLREQYDAIIIDSSPVLLVPDALMVGGCVDGVLLSVRPGVSEAGEVYAAYTRLVSHHLPFLGAVVNGVSLRSTYAGGYGYGRPASEPTA